MTAHMKLSLNPIQWMATSDGWLDPALAPPPRELLRQVKQAGFDHVMAAVPEGLTVSQYVDLTRRAGLGLAPGYVVCRFDGTADAADAAVSSAVAAAEQCAEMGLSTIGLGAGMVKGAPRVNHPARGEDSDPDRLGALIEVVGQMAEAMGELGVRPDLHPHVGTWVETEQEARQVLDRIPSDLLGFLPDLGHLSWAGADVPSLLEDYGTRVSFVHVKDYRPDVAHEAMTRDWGYQKTVMQGLWVEPGRGGLDIRALVGLLPADFRGHLMVEVDRPDIADPYESAVASAAWMRKAFEFDQ